MVWWVVVVVDECDGVGWRWIVGLVVVEQMIGLPMGPPFDEDFVAT